MKSLRTTARADRNRDTARHLRRIQQRHQNPISTHLCWRSVSCEFGKLTSSPHKTSKESSQLYLNGATDDATTEVIAEFSDEASRPLFRYHLNGEPAAKDFLWRQWKTFKATGAGQSECAVVQYQFRETSEVGKLVIDDFQTNLDTDLASSGMAVSFDVDDLSEGRFDDADTSFTDTPLDPFNGFTFGRASDVSRGIVFNYDAADRQLVFSTTTDTEDWSSYDLLSFRASQATRHPLTDAFDEDQVFEVRLVDQAGNSSVISIGAFGAGLEELYPRTSCGSGTGWAAEMETFRLRLADFLVDGTNVDLETIDRLEFLFGPSHGTPSGRIGMDDIELVRE